jgi:hypothetical protein
MRIAVARSAIGAFAVATALALAGCVTNQQTPSLAEAEGATIIFESIDGPPRPVSARLARSLDQEAATRRLVVVTRGGQALYHIRGYVAANAEGGTTSLAWAFDVYDAERRRAFRLSGEERASSSGAWTAASDQVLQRIASSSLEQIMAFIASDRTGAGSNAAAASQGAVLASPADDFRPETAGIFRMFAGLPPPAAENNGPPAR